MFLNPVEKKENCDAIFLGIARLQGQFVRKAARLSTQRKEGGEKLQAIKFLGRHTHAYIHIYAHICNANMWIYACMWRPRSFIAFNFASLLTLLPCALE